MGALMVLALSLHYAPTRDIGRQLDAAGEARVAVLGKQLRCAVCQGVAIVDSPASMAQAQLSKVRELVAEGKSDEGVLTYFVQRYGEWVLLEPTKTGLNSLLWAGPLVLLVLGLIVILMQQKRPVAAPVLDNDAAVAAAGSANPAETEDPLLARVRADLEK